MRPGALWGLLPVAVAAAWVPLRDVLPGTDVALLLVVSVVAAATAGGRAAAVVAPVASVIAFDFFDTPPYGQLLMTRGRDVATALVLLGAGLVVGDIAVRLRAYRGVAARRGEDFTVMASAARLLAHGEDTGLVIGALAGELIGRLDLVDCRFVPVPPGGDRPWVTRDGQLAPGVGAGVAAAGPGGAPAGPGMAGEGRIVDLPVWSGDTAVGRFELEFGPGARPAADRLVTAIGIAEQAGAALAATPPARPLHPVRGRRLRVVR